MRFLASATEVQGLISKGNDFFPFLELSTSDLLDFKRASAASMASMSLNQTGKNLVLRKGGVRNVLRMCVHLDLSVQREAVFCIANFVSSPDYRQYVTKEGGVETLKAVVATCNDVEILRDAARALSFLSVNTPTRAIMISQDIPLSKLAKSSDISTQRYAALALCNLCQGTTEQKETIVKQSALRILLFLLRYPDLEMESLAALSVALLSCEYLRCSDVHGIDQVVGRKIVHRFNRDQKSRGISLFAFVGKPRLSQRYQRWWRSRVYH